MALITASGGLYLESDSVPYTGTTLSALAGIVDGNYWTGGSGSYWLAHYSYGVDLGASTSVGHLMAYITHGLSSSETTFYTTAAGTFQVLSSDDNATWTVVETFTEPPITVSEAYHCGIKLELATPSTARYFKVVASDSAIAVGAGASAYLHEVEAWNPASSEVAVDTNFSLTSSISATSDSDIQPSVSLGLSPVASATSDSDVQPSVSFGLANVLSDTTGFDISAGFSLATTVDTKLGEKLNVGFGLGTNVYVFLVDNDISVGFSLGAEITGQSPKICNISSAFAIGSQVYGSQALPATMKAGFSIGATVQGSNIVGNTIKVGFKLGEVDISAYSERQNMAASATFEIGTLAILNTVGASCSLPSYSNDRWT